jgi:hypothetical protein
MSSNKPVSPRTFNPIKLDNSKYNRGNRKNFIEELKRDLVQHRKERQEFYKQRREQNNPNGLRWWMAVLALVGTIASALAAGLRVSTVLLANKTVPFLNVPADKLDLWFFAVALSAFSLLGGLAIYEKSLDLSAAYFRHNAVTMAIRDLWTKMEFEFFKELMKEDDGPISDADFDRLLELAQAFCNDINKLTSDEHGEFKTEFLASMSELDALAKKGLTDTAAQFEKAVKAHKADVEKIKEEAENAKKEAEAAAKKAVEAAKAAKEASEATAKPGYLNITIKGNVDGNIAVKINGKEHTKSAGKNFSIGDLKQGVVHLELVAKKGNKSITYDRYLNVAAGLQNVDATLFSQTMNQDSSCGLFL